MDAEWDVVGKRIPELLADNASRILAFRAKAVSIFKAMLEGKPPTKRRPPASLRLICKGDPPGKLIVHPEWNYSRKVVVIEEIECELLEERDVTVMALNPETGQKEKTAARQFAHQFSMDVQPDGPLKPRSYRLSAVKDVARIVEVMRDFINDHNVVFARSHSNCCCCGKGLTDELSRSRGIGPECIKHIPLVRAVDRNSIVVEQPAPELTAERVVGSEETEPWQLSAV
jgi:hypothetical protein